MSSIKTKVTFYYFLFASILPLLKCGYITDSNYGRGYNYNNGYGHGHGQGHGYSNSNSHDYNNQDYHDYHDDHSHHQNHQDIDHYDYHSGGGGGGGGGGHGGVYSSYNGHHGHQGTAHSYGDETPPSYSYHPHYYECHRDPACLQKEKLKLIEAERLYLIALKSWISHLTIVRRHAWRTVYPNLAVQYDILCTKYETTRIQTRYHHHPYLKKK